MISFLAITLSMFAIIIILMLCIAHSEVTNEDNSSASVRCVTETTCRARHTELCKDCKYNHYKEPQSFYRPKKKKGR